MLITLLTVAALLVSVAPLVLCIGNRSRSRAKCESRSAIPLILFGLLAALPAYSEIDTVLTPNLRVAGTNATATPAETTPTSFSGTTPSVTNRFVTSGGALARAGAHIANGINTVLYADEFAGADIGEQVNAAYAALPPAGGYIRIAAGSYSFSTPIVFDIHRKLAYLECDPGGSSSSGAKFRAATILTYSGTGAAVTFNAGVNGPGGMSGCALFGPGTSTASQGLLVGGNNGAIGHVFEKNEISNFGAGIQFANNAYILTFRNNIIHDNGTNGANNVYAPAGLAEFGENINFTGGMITNKSTVYPPSCVNLQSAGDFHFTGGISFDQCGLTFNDTNGEVDSTNNHWENSSGVTASPYITLGPGCNGCNLTSSGDYFTENGVSARQGFIEVQSTVPNNATTVTLLGLTITPAEVIPQIVNNIGEPCCAQVYALGVRTNGNSYDAVAGPPGAWLFGFEAESGKLNFGTPGKYTSFFSSNSRKRNVTWPDADGTVVLTSAQETLTSKTIASPIIGAGIAANGSGFKHKRSTPGCVTAAWPGASCATTITWSTSFADGNYTAVCQGSGVSSGVPVLGPITDKSGASITIATTAVTAAPAKFSSIECIAVHD